VRRGDIVTVAIKGEYGKSRPALVIQSDFVADTDSILVCLITAMLRDSPMHRLALPAGGGTGLRRPSQIMVDKIIPARRDRCGPTIGRADGATLTALRDILAFVVGIGD
jgi:mRNA interferase MazF